MTVISGLSFLLVALISTVIGYAVGHKPRKQEIEAERKEELKAQCRKLNKENMELQLENIRLGNKYMVLVMDKSRAIDPTAHEQTK